MIDETLLQDLPLGQQIEITENTIRKNFTFSEMCEIISKLKPKLDEEAKKRRQAGVKLSPGEPKFKVRDEIAHYVGVSGGQIDKIMAIEQQVRENPKEFGNIPQRIESGMSIDYAHKMINTAKKATTPTPNLPKNQYEVIVADPPWKYDLPLEGAPDYKTMTLEEMKLEIPNVPSYKDCILFMWTTNPKLDEALSLMKHWGFTYKTNMVWVKQKNNKLQNGTGYYFKGSHELLLVGTKGNPGVPPESVRVSSVGMAERTRHSEKPRMFYRMIEKYYPAKKKFEMFARGKDSADDGTWTYWGDSVQD